MKNISKQRIRIKMVVSVSAEHNWDMYNWYNVQEALKLNAASNNPDIDFSALSVDEFAVVGMDEWGNEIPWDEE